MSGGADGVTAVTAVAAGVAAAAAGAEVGAESGLAHPVQARRPTEGGR